MCCPRFIVEISEQDNLLYFVRRIIVSRRNDNIYKLAEKQTRRRSSIIAGPARNDNMCFYTRVTQCYMYNLQPPKTRGRQLYIKRARGRDGARVSINVYRIICIWYCFQPFRSVLYIVR